MLISTKGRYALRVMIDLAESGLEEYVPLKEIADRAEISRKYHPNIMTVLSKAGLVDAIHGKGGGSREMIQGTAKASEAVIRSAFDCYVEK